MFSKILIAVDGSDNNKLAVDQAVDICKAMGAKLTAVYVSTGAEVKPNAFGGDVSAGERNSINNKMIDDALAYVKAKSEGMGIAIETLVLHGNPSNEIVKISKDYDLVVCGSLGLTGISKMLMGSVSSSIAKYADCPVLIARN